MVKTVCRYLFHLREIRKQTLGTFKKSSNFEQRERKYANTWSGEISGGEKVFG